jgi:copper chaperone NosL
VALVLGLTLTALAAKGTHAAPSPKVKYVRLHHHQSEGGKMRLRLSTEADENNVKGGFMKLRKNVPVMLCLVLLSMGGQAAYAGHDHQHAEEISIPAQADIKKNPDCQQCGMDRDKFSHSRMLITYADGSSVATCSISCAATEMKHNPGKSITSIQVADYVTNNLIDARKALWVLGGRKRGVMTPVAKWAFTTREDAEKFVQVNGGRITGYDEALDVAMKEHK